MPQKDMRIVADPGGKATVLAPESGPALEGEGDLTYRCGGCKTRLISNATHNQLWHGEHFDAVKCPKCGKFNQLPHEDHHHH